MPVPGIELRAFQPLPLSEESRAAPFNGVASCNIGYIDGRNFSSGEEPITAGVVGLGGWLVDEVSHNVPPVANLIFLNDQMGQGFSVPVTAWLTRPDVQDAHGGLDAYRKSGFVAEVDLTSLVAGRYHVYMTFTAADSTYTCDNGRYINLTPRH